MTTESGLSSWGKRWLCNGANLITLSRIPMTIVLMCGFAKLLASYPYQANTESQTELVVTFLLVALLQAIGMITDGVDGWFARKHSKIGPTPEGQFLDQFIDKVFVWILWWALAWHFYANNIWAFGQWISLFFWWLPSLLLFVLDLRSCKRHWQNYQKDKGKPVNLKHGAVLQGKIKFVCENVTVCMMIIILAPRTEAEYWYEYLSNAFNLVSQTSPYVAHIALYVAIALALSSLKKRGVIKTKEQKIIDKYKPKHVAEAVVDLGDEGNES